MANLIDVVGMDPSLRNWGIARGTYDITSKILDITQLYVLKTPPKPKIKAERARAIVQNGLYLKEELNKILKPTDMVFAEYPIGSQMFDGAIGYAAVLILLGTLKKDGINIYEVSPNQVKLATIGNRTASKQEIADRAFKLYPNANWPTKTQKGITSVKITKAEHMADAIGTIEAGIKFLNH